MFKKQKKSINFYMMKLTYFRGVEITRLNVKSGLRKSCTGKTPENQSTSVELVFSL